MLYYLAGLTCTEDTGYVCIMVVPVPSAMNTDARFAQIRSQKGGLLKDAASEGIALIFPDTSPRGAGIAGEEDDWDFGTGT